MNSDMEKAMEYLAHTCDGPATGFVVLMRKVQEGGDPDLWGNAVTELLLERGIDINGGK